MPVLTAPDRPTHELPGTRFTALASPSRGSRETSVWQVEIDPRTPATPHAVTREEIVVVLTGRADLRIGDIEQQVGPGDTVVIPADTMFSIGCAGGEPLTAICIQPVGGQAQLPGERPFTPPWAL